MLKILSHNFKVMVTLPSFLLGDIYSVVNIILIYHPRLILLATFYRLYEPFPDMTKLVMVTSMFVLPVPIWASRKKMKMQRKRVWKLSATDNILHAYRLLPNELWLANCKAFLMSHNSSIAPYFSPRFSEEEVGVINLWPALHLQL